MRSLLTARENNARTVLVFGLAPVIRANQPLGRSLEYCAKVFFRFSALANFLLSQHPSNSSFIIFSFFAIEWMEFGAATVGKFRTTQFCT